MTDPYSDVLEGVALYAYGHSYLASDFAGQAPGQRYVNRSASRLGMAVKNRAQGGNRMMDAALDMLNGVKAWGLSEVGIVLIDCTVNDFMQSGASPQALLGYRHSLRSALRYPCLGSRIEDDSPAIYRQGGRTLVTSDYTGGHNWMLNAGEAGYASVTMQAGGPLLVGLAGLAGNTGGKFDLLLDGQVVAVHDSSSQFLSSASTGNTSGPVTYHLPVSVGEHRVTVRPVGGAGALSTGSGPFLDYVGVMSPPEFAPRLILMKALHLPPNGYVRSTAGASDAVVDTYNQIIEEEAAAHRALGYGVTVVDASVGWLPLEMTGEDGVHPNARGNAHIASALVAQFPALGWSPGVTG